MNGARTRANGSEYRHEGGHGSEALCGDRFFGAGEVRLWKQFLCMESVLKPMKEKHGFHVSRMRAGSVS